MAELATKYFNDPTTPHTKWVSSTLDAYVMGRLDDFVGNISVRHGADELNRKTYKNVLFTGAFQYDIEDRAAVLNVNGILSLNVESGREMAEALNVFRFILESLVFDEMEIASEGSGFWVSINFLRTD